MSAAEKVKKNLSRARLYWKTPPPGRYITYKEIAALGGGGIGVKFILGCAGGVMLNVGNAFIGNTIGIQPMQLYVLYLLSVLASFPLTMLRAYIIDNTRGRKGKYRPYILSMGLPTVVLSIAYFWMPYERMNNITKYVVVLLFNVGFQFFYMFLYDAYSNYIVVLSPNTQERADVSAIRAIVDCLAPSITGAVIPLAGKLITGTDNLFDIRIYRYLWPPILIAGFLLSIVVYVNTEEKIVQAKTHVVQIKFADALRAVLKNKYFWIISLAGWLGFLEGSYGSILAWLYTYQHACKPLTYTVITMLNGNASLWGMMLAPLAVRRIGKRSTLILTNVLNIFFLAAIYPIVKRCNPSAMIWLVLICLWMNSLVNSFANILNPSLNGDIRDYQQYITGERIDGMFAAVGLIGSVVTMATGSVSSLIYRYVGFNEEKLTELLPSILASGEVIADTANVYNVLYDRATFISIFGVLVSVSVIGAFLNVLPYFWYDLSEVRQRGMVKVLQIRALFEDYGNGVLRDKELVEAIDAIREARELAGGSAEDVSRAGIRAAKGRAERKAAAKARRAAVEYNQALEVSKIVMDEMDRFNTPEGLMQLKEARRTVEAGYDYIYGFDRSRLAAAKALPKNTAEEKAYRKAEISRARDAMYAKRIALRNFPDGIREFNAGVFEKLFADEDDVAQRIENKYRELYAARDAKDKALVAGCRAELRKLRAQKREAESAVKKATDENSLYMRAAKPYIQAKKLLQQCENYSRFDEIAAMYDGAKARHAEVLAEAMAQSERLQEEEKKALTAKLRAEKRRRRRE